MGAKKKGGKGGKKGGKGKKGKKALPTAPLEIATGESTSMSVIPVKSINPSSFKKHIATFVFKYAHPNMPFFSPKQLEANPIEQTNSLKRSNTIVEFLIRDHVAPLWLTSGHNPEPPAPPVPVETKKEENMEEEPIDDYSISGDDQKEPEQLQFHQVTVKAEIDSEFSIRITNEFVFTRIAAEIFVDGRLVSDGKYIIEPAPSPPLVVRGFEVQDTSENSQEGISNRLANIEKFTFQKRVAVSDTLTREILNAGFDGDIVVNIYR